MFPPSKPATTERCSTASNSDSFRIPVGPASTNRFFRTPRYRSASLPHHALVEPPAGDTGGPRPRRHRPRCRARRLRSAGGRGLGDDIAAPGANWCRAASWCLRIFASTRLAATREPSADAICTRRSHGTGAPCATSAPSLPTNFTGPLSCRTTAPSRSFAPRSMIPRLLSAVPGWRWSTAPRCLLPSKNLPRAARMRWHSLAIFMPSLRAFSESTFLDALEPGRPQTERQAIIDRFYAAYEADVAAAPEAHRKDGVHCFIRVGRVGWAGVQGDRTSGTRPAASRKRHRVQMQQQVAWDSTCPVLLGMTNCALAETEPL